MATIDLGRLGFVNKGTYNNSTTYEKNDLVQFTDSGILSTYLYIDSTAQSGQAPSSSGTAGSRWVFFAKGVADAVASAGNNKVLVTNASGNLTPLSIGSAGTVLKTNSSANGFEFGSGSKIGQVLQTVKTSTFSHTFGSGVTFHNITGLSQAITPTATSSKVLLMVTVCAYAAAGCQAYIDTIRDTTQIFVGDSSSNRVSATAMANLNGSTVDWSTSNIHYTFLDTPNTTSSTTYQVRLGGFNSGVNHINRSDRDSASTSYDARLASSITLIEVLA